MAVVDDGQQQRRCVERARCGLQTIFDFEEVLRGAGIEIDEVDAGQIGQVEEARDLGAAAIITKPFSPKKLYRQVCGLMGEDPVAEIGGES